MNEFKTERVAKANYTYGTTNDGSTGDGIGLGVNIPQGAVVTGIVSRENTAFTSGGSATIDINVGSSSLATGVAYDTGFAGVDEQLARSAADEASGEISIDINTAALTAGDVDFFVYYIV